MAGPIAKPRNVAARTRRRQGSSPLFRAALAVALVVTCVLALPKVMLATRTTIASGGGSEPPVLASGQIVMAGLQPGACMSFAPSDGRANRTVFIDPGHGGLDPGVVGSAGGKQVLEKDATLAVATRLSTVLRANGYRVVMARTADSSVVKLTADDSVTGAMTADAVHRDLVQRAECANAGQASVLVSIHFDGFDDPSVGGSETFYDAARPFAAENRRLATDLQAALVAGLGSDDRGVWTDDQLAAPTLTTSGSLYDHLIELGPRASGWVENPSQMPGALVEPLFITNPTEARLANDPAGQQRMALSLETGLQKYFAGA
jgi:N-acetylmuramoyl-L-alanine amidase